MDRIEVQPASVGQVVRSQRGSMVAIDDDVAGIARQLREIDPRLMLEFDRDQGFYIVSIKDGPDEGLIATALELDQRLVDAIRRIAHPSYRYADELERVEDKARREREHYDAEQRGPHVERLAWALRKDFQIKDRVFVPKDV